MSDRKLNFEADGAKYFIDLDDFNAIDAKDFAPAVGMPLSAVYRGEALDLHALAGLVWLVRRRTNSTLTYEEVAESISYGNLRALDDDEITSESPESSPEA